MRAWPVRECRLLLFSPPFLVLVGVVEAEPGGILVPTLCPANESSVGALGGRGRRVGALEGRWWSSDGAGDLAGGRARTKVDGSRIRRPGRLDYCGVVGGCRILGGARWSRDVPRGLFLSFFNF